VHISNQARVAFAVFTDFCINTAILMISYPIWREFQYQRYPSSYWIRAYLLAGFISTLIVLGIASVLTGIWKKIPDKRLLIAQIAITFTVLSILAISCDFSSPYALASWPQMLQLIAAKFFAELQSFRFMMLTASYISIFSGVALWFAILAPRNTSGS
jgi:hypothetical protein